MPLILSSLRAYVVDEDEAQIHVALGVLLDAIEEPQPLFADALPATVALAVDGASCLSLSAEARCHFLQARDARARLPGRRPAPLGAPRVRGCHAKFADAPACR